MVRFLTVLFFFLFQFSFSQTDSLSYYLNKGELDKAIKYGENVVKNNTKEDEDSATALSNLAYLYDKKADYSKAEPLYLKSLEIRKKVTGEINPDFVTSLCYLASLYFRQGAYLKAEPLFLQALDINKKVFGEIHPQYVSLHYSLAFLYDKQGVYTKAEFYYLQSVEVLKKTLGEENKKYLVSLDSLSKFYLGQNNLAKADYYNQLGLDIVTKKFGKKHKEYFTFLVNKAYIKSSLGQHKIALDLYDECIGLAKDLYGRESEIYGTMISNSIYPMLGLGGNYKNAEKLLLIDYEITKKYYGDNHQKTAMCLTRLATNYTSLKDDKKALDYYLTALEIVSNTIGKNSNDYAIICSSLGTHYAQTKDFINAEKYYLISYNIRLLLFGKSNSLNLINLKNFVDFYSEFEKKENQKTYLLEYLDLLKRNLLEMNINFSQNELLSYTKKILPNNTYLSIFNQQPNKYSEINIGCYENELLLKNLSLRNQQRIKNSIEKSNDVILKEKHQQFVANKRYLTKLEELPLAQRPSDFESLKTETESLEKDITRQSATFADAKKTLSISWKQIQEKLLPNDVVIDLVSYHYYNKKWTDSIMYGAFVIKKDSKFPKYINLFEEKQLAALLERNTMAADTIQAKILNKQYSDKAISDLFLKPLEKEFNGCKTIYLSPSGLGHQINFKALPISENQTFGEQFNIKLVGSSASIVSYKTTAFQENKSLEIILYGGIDYSKSSVTTQTNEENKVAVRSNFEGGFGYLKGTLAEISSIANQVKTNKYNAILKTERNATEESIKQLDGKKEPFVLHLATHGYFFPDPKQELQKEDLLSDSKFKIYKTADDPMMRSGLLFAGANKYWGKSTENPTTDDGILTASEISNLDLSSCQLVVMSACETGLGQINGSEGVFGLQRAFKMAGVKNIIMSLWKVPDAQTAELFDIFYTECFAGKSIQEAFQIAQAKMKLKYSPYYWAGFVLLE